MRARPLKNLSKNRNRVKNRKENDDLQKINEVNKVELI